MGERSGTQSREYVVLERVRGEDGEPTKELRERGRVRARGHRSAISKVISPQEIGIFVAIPEVHFQPQHLGTRPVRVWVGG